MGNQLAQGHLKIMPDENFKGKLTRELKALSELWLVVADKLLSGIFYPFSWDTPLILGGFLLLPCLNLHHSRNSYL